MRKCCKEEVLSYLRDYYFAIDCEIKNAFRDSMEYGVGGFVAETKNILKEEMVNIEKELGVDDNQCQHANKNYSHLATAACATRYRIVFWECEDCGYLAAEQPTREELGVG